MHNTNLKLKEHEPCWHGSEVEHQSMNTVRFLTKAHAQGCRLNSRSWGRGWIFFNIQKLEEFIRVDMHYKNGLKKFIQEKENDARWNFGPTQRNEEHWKS